ncbi:DUF6319 domain-containing protein [Nocardia ninae]|uniref:Cell wall anchor protein n=1 Tax=Nocardia ninae NBRC 108245 TaxID=1210091 RepID=A0A511MAJ6_9NOCA|nr:DUF6319 family protein [Nocardia ninae]GEM37683.1 hypothetical protein NN4_22020 [Nocardia ninae NBRC 108245]
MPSPKTKPKPLSDSEIQRIATDIAGGRPPMVWFTAAAVGVPEGRSGKVISLGDPADGDFLQVRPTGSKDVLSFSPTEVTLTKPPRGAAPVSTAQPKSTTRKESPVTQPSTLTSTATPPTPSSVTPPPVVPKPVASTPESDDQDGGASKPAAKSTPAPAKAAKAPARPKAKTAEVTVTLTGTADGEWSVDVVSGKKRAVRGLAVPSSAVAQAAKILHPEVADVVAGILDAAREAQEAKVQQLQAELEAAKRLLDELVD